MADRRHMGRPIRFLHLSTFYPPWSFGGDAIILRRLAHALADDGHEVDVVHCLDAYHLLHPGPPERPLPDHPGVRVHALHSPWGRLSPVLTQQTGRPLFKTRALRRILASRPYDVVHFHNSSLLGPRALAMKPPAARAVTLYTAYEHWLVCPTHVLWKHGRAVCERPSCLTCVLGARRPPQYWRYTSMLDRAAAEIDQFITLSQSSADVHAARGFRRPMTPVAPYAERADDDWRRPGPSPHPRPYFLFVGRLEPIKGVHTLVDAWRQIPDFDLLIAGSGREEPSLRARAADNPRIRMLGFRPQGELGALYAHAHACIMPSLTFETFGIVAIEAFARKTPVIVRDIGALNDIVAASGGGVVYRTELELSAAVAAIGGNDAYRRMLGERGYDAFTRLWTREAHLSAYYALLERTAAAATGSVPWAR